MCVGGGGVVVIYIWDTFDIFVFKVLLESNGVLILKWSLTRKLLFNSI